MQERERIFDEGRHIRICRAVALFEQRVDLNG